jgi:hypothetical protein
MTPHSPSSEQPDGRGRRTCPAGTVSTSEHFFFDTGPMPAYSLTRNDPLGGHSTPPRLGLRSET